LGSAVAYNLAKRGIKILALEKFSLNHKNGSSHGLTRMIRLAYSEHPSYVPPVKKAYELWFTLQKECGKEIIKITGGVTFGYQNGELISGVIKSAKEHDLEYYILSSKESHERYNIFRLLEDEVCLFEPTVGIVYPER
jgi:sarcosine oxidase